MIICCCNDTSGGDGSGCHVNLGGGMTAEIPASDLTLDWYTNEVDPGTGDYTGTLLPVTTPLAYVPSTHSWQSAVLQLPYPSVAFSANNTYGQGPCSYYEISLGCGGSLSFSTGNTPSLIGDQPCGGPGSLNYQGLIPPSGGSASPFSLQYGTPGGGVGQQVFANGMIS